ncbi:MAG: response regulator transcription factor [Chitinophagaceae bacterium]|nr:response regulator transcription factor [Chitinophagaceae bacterium]
MKHIILIEDDDAIRDSLSIFFRGENIKITSYPDGRAVMTGDYSPPDLFLVDKQLPGMNGLDICRHLKTQPDSKDIPVIMISARPGIIREAESAGADDVLVKPCKLSVIRRVISRFL